MPKPLKKTTAQNLSSQGAMLEYGSGNVFQDLGLPGADVLLIKAKLGVRIHQIIKARKLTQAAAAQILGTQQPKISNLFQGRFDGYTIDRLIKYLNKLDQAVDVVVEERKQG